MVPFHEHVRILHLSARARLEAYSRLFRFTTEEDINPKDFAEKTGMSLISVNSMIRHAKQNAKLYEEMVGLGYSDESFPVWWYSPGREGTEVKVVGQGGTTEEGGGQGGTTEEDKVEQRRREEDKVGQPRREEDKLEGGGQNWREGKTLHPHPRIPPSLGKVDQLYLRLLSGPLLSAPLREAPRMSHLIPPPPPMRRYPC